MQVDLVIAIILAAALALIVGMVSRFLTISGLKKNAESKIGNAEAKAREIIDDAVKTAETTKKEALLEVKEESIKRMILRRRQKKEERNCSAMKKECWQKKRQLISVLMC